MIRYSRDYQFYRCANGHLCLFLDLLNIRIRLLYDYAIWIGGPSIHIPVALGTRKDYIFTCKTFCTKRVVKVHLIN